MYQFGRVHLYPRLHMYPRYEEIDIKPVLQARVLPPPLPHPHSALQLANRLPVKLGPLPSPRPPPPSARQSASQTPPPSLCHTPSPRDPPPPNLRTSLPVNLSPQGPSPIS